MPAPTSPPPPLVIQRRVDSVFQAKRRASSPAETTPHCRTIQKGQKKGTRARSRKAATGLVFNADADIGLVFDQVLGQDIGSDLDDALGNVLEDGLPAPTCPEQSRSTSPESGTRERVVSLSDATRLEAFNAQWIFSEAEIESGLAQPTETRTWEQILYCDEPPLESEPPAVAQRRRRRPVEALKGMLTLVPAPVSMWM
jgi:hypothetical protein